MSDHALVDALWLDADQTYHVGDRLCFVVKAPFEMPRKLPPIIGRVIYVGGKNYLVTSVGRYAISDHIPIRRGELIDLMVEPVESQ